MSIQTDTIIAGMTVKHIEHVHKETQKDTDIKTKELWWNFIKGMLSAAVFITLYLTSQLPITFKVIILTTLVFSILIQTITHTAIQNILNNKGVNHVY